MLGVNPIPSLNSEAVRFSVSYPTNVPMSAGLAQRILRLGDGGAQCAGGASDVSGQITGRATAAAVAEEAHRGPASGARNHLEWNFTAVAPNTNGLRISPTFGRPNIGFISAFC